jgi:hypothetical protein
MTRPRLGSVLFPVAAVVVLGVGAASVGVDDAGRVRPACPLSGRCDCDDPECPFGVTENACRTAIADVTRAVGLRGATGE